MTLWNTTTSRRCRSVLSVANACSMPKVPSAGAAIRQWSAPAIPTATMDVTSSHKTKQSRPSGIARLSRIHSIHRQTTTTRFTRLTTTLGLKEAATSLKTIPSVTALQKTIPSRHPTAVSVKLPCAYRPEHHQQHRFSSMVMRWARFLSRLILLTTTAVPATMNLR